MSEHVDVAVIGAGQAGLSTSHELARRGIEHVVLERARVGESWRKLWDSFCLVSPNWTVQLPGFGYAGGDPDGFMKRDEIVAHLERYAATIPAPVRTGVEVRSLSAAEGGRFRLDTSVGEIRARAVVVATGAYQRPHRPTGAAGLAPGILRLDSSEYDNPSRLPDGQVLIIGSGQSGCQIAEELRRAGRDVFLACGRVPWVPRRVGDRDVFWWLVESGFADAPPSSLPSPAARLGGNATATGAGGGRDLSLRTLHALGVTLLGHFLEAEGHEATFADDLGEVVAWGDEKYGQVADFFRKFARQRGLPEPHLPPPEPFHPTAPTKLDLHGFGAVIFAGGYRPDYSWIAVPGAFDELGFPLHTEGESIAAPGLHFVGVHFLRKRKSSLLIGVGEDAAIVAARIEAERLSVAV